MEIRSPDGSAHIYYLLAGIAAAVVYGIQWEGCLEYTEKQYLKANSSKKETFKQLPESCFECGEALLEERAVYEASGIFTPAVLEGIVEDLKAYNDKNIGERLLGSGAQLKKLVENHLHCG